MRVVRDLGTCFAFLIADVEIAFSCRVARLPLPPRHLGHPPVLIHGSLERLRCLHRRVARS
jgi:hypothetical protein